MKYLTLSLSLFSIALIHGQSVIINEVVSSNSIYIDEDGDGYGDDYDDDHGC